MSNPTQALNDAERGVAENVFPVDLPPPATPMSGGTTRVNSLADLKMAQQSPPPLPISEKPLSDEKKAEVSVAVADVKKESSAVDGKKKPAPAKPKWKRASKWVQFKLWYNTYR